MATEPASPLPALLEQDSVDASPCLAGLDITSRIEENTINIHTTQHTATQVLQPQEPTSAPPGVSSLAGACLQPDGQVVQQTWQVVKGALSQEPHTCSHHSHHLDVPQDCLVVPGFVDAHVHLVYGGKTTLHVGLAVGSRDAFVEAIRRGIATRQEGPQWLLGFNWDPVALGAMPHRDWIDGVTGEVPVLLSRNDGHSCMVNSAALKVCGIDEDTPEPEGGVIDRDPETGRLTGILCDAAMQLVSSSEHFVPAGSDFEAMEAAVQLCNQNGITCVHTMACLDKADAEFREIETILAAADAGVFTNRLRVRMHTPIAELDRLHELLEKHPSRRTDPWVRVNGMKGFVDGSLGSRTAVFWEPLEGGNRNVYVTQPTAMASYIKAATEAGVQCAVHAIGDRAVTEIIDMFIAAVDGDKEACRAQRFRIEHAQHLRPQDAKRMAEYGIIASVQPMHVLDDGRFADKVLGEARSREAYPFRSMIEQGIHVALGSDWPVAPAVPLQAIQAAVTRQTTAHGPDGWNPQERLSPVQAVLGHTMHAAYAGKDDGILGKIAPGYAADLAILRGARNEDGILNFAKAQVVGTIVAGHLVYATEHLAHHRTTKDA